LDYKTPNASEDLHSLVRTQIEQAVNFVDEELSPARARLARYFEGELPDIDADVGRSQAVDPVVRDAVNAMKPSLLRAFFGPERVVEFRPRKAEDAALAQQQTEYINYIVCEDNPGFLTVGAALEDALVKDFGVVKWWWDDREQTEGVTYDHLHLPDLEQMMAKVEDDPATDITIESIEPNQLGGLKVALTRVRRMGRARIVAVPPDEFLFNRSARSLDTATFVAHRSLRTQSDLIAMGYPKQDIEDAVGHGDDLDYNEESVERKEWGGLSTDTVDDTPGGEGGEPLRLVKYVECYLLYDQDGDDIAELRKVCTVGDAYTVVHNEPADHIPFAVGMVDPKPHTMQGRGVGRRVSPYQAIKSVVLRGTLDSLALSIVPGTEVVEGQVNMKDLLNTELGKIVRVKQPGMLREIGSTWVGKDTLPMLDHFSAKIEDATGTSRAAAGLNPDALQSSTKAAVAATVTASQQQIELVARNLAETLFKPMFRGLYRLIKMHQSEQRMVKLFGAFVPVDPGTWDDADPDVTVNVALGMGLTEERIGALTAIGQDQKEILMTMGFENPIVTMKQFRDTLAKKAELAGWKNTDQFYQNVPPDWKPPETPPPEPPPPDPVAMELAKIEAQKVQGQQALDKARFEFDVKQAMAEYEFKVAQATAEDARKRDEMIVKAEIEQLKIDAEHAKLALANLQSIRDTATSPEAG